MAVRIGGAAVLIALVGGCTYDYLQRSDRVAYSAGDAVRANIARETDNPDKRSMYDTRGLGRNGVVKPPADPATTP